MNKNAKSPVMVDIMNCESNGMSRCLMSEYKRRISIAIAGTITKRLKLFVICVSRVNGINPDSGKSISDCMLVKRVLILERVWSENISVVALFNSFDWRSLARSRLEEHSSGDVTSSPSSDLESYASIL